MTDAQYLFEVVCIAYVLEHHAVLIGIGRKAIQRCRRQC